MYPYLSFFNITVPSYGLCLALAIFLCSFLAIKKASCLGILWEDMIILAASSVGVGLLGGGLLYFFVSYTPTQMLNFIKNQDLSFLINGGLVFYGSLIGGILGALLAAKFLHLDIPCLERCIIPCIPLGHAIGRIGCLLAGCCHGVEYTGILAVRSHLFSQNTYFPLQVVEAAFNLMIMLLLFFYAKKPRSQYSILNIYLLFYSLIRFFLEYFRGDAIRGHILSLSTSQWISLCLISLCAIRQIGVWTRKRKSL